MYTKQKHEKSKNLFAKIILLVICILLFGISDNIILYFIYVITSIHITNKIIICLWVRIYKNKRYKEILKNANNLYVEGYYTFSLRNIEEMKLIKGESFVDWIKKNAFKQDYKFYSINKNILSYEISRTFPQGLGPC